MGNMRIFWTILLFLTTTFFTICLTIGIIQIGYGSLPNEISYLVFGEDYANNAYWDYSQYYFGLSSIMAFITNYSKANENLRMLFFLQPFSIEIGRFTDSFADLQSQFTKLLSFDIFNADYYLNIFGLIDTILTGASYLVSAILVFIFGVPVYLVYSLVVFFRMFFELLTGAYNQPMYPGNLQPITTFLFLS